MSAEQKIQLEVQGLSCVGCAENVSKQLHTLGLKDAQVNFVTKKAYFTLSGQTTLEVVLSSLKKLGYPAKQLEQQEHRTEGAHPHHLSESSVSVRVSFIISLILSVPLLTGMFLPWPLLHSGWFQCALSLPVLLIGLYQFGPRALGSLRLGAANMDVLILLGCLAAFGYSIAGTVLHLGHEYLYYETSATIITIVLLGNLLEERATKKTTEAVIGLRALKPERALKIIDAQGSTKEIAYEEIQIGDLLRVSSGSRIPVDGIINEGNALIDEAVLRGESVPQERSANDRALSGALVVQGSITIRAEQIGSDTLLSKIAHLVESAQLHKPKIQRIGDAVSAIFVPVVLALSLLTFVVTISFTDHSFADALFRAVAVLVVACPCAMGLATPTAVMVGIGNAARRGILFKGGDVLEQISTIKTVIFDKTGTLTDGHFVVSGIESTSPQESFLAVLRAFGTHSTHPLAKSLPAQLPVGPIEPLSDITETPGVGVSGNDSSGIPWSLGGKRMLNEKLHGRDASHSGELFLFREAQCVAGVAISDSPRHEAAQAIQNFKALGILTVMLSGDRKERCEKLGKELGIDQIYSEQLPDQKVALVREITKSSPVLFVGDGVNDAPALAAAHVGASLSGASDIAIDVAQLVLLTPNLTRLNDALAISRKTNKIIKQNLFWAFIYNIVAIPLAMSGFLSPLVAALAMTFSDICVILNSLRLRKI